MKRCVKKVSPIANRVLIFTTDVNSFHGHPEPMRCPAGVARRSLALYYFSIEADPVVRSTEYRARPGDGAHAIMIYADKQMLRVYDWMKRHLGVSDQAASRMLAFRDKLWRGRSEGLTGLRGHIRSPSGCATHHKAETPQRVRLHGQLVSWGVRGGNRMNRLAIVDPLPVLQRRPVVHHVSGSESWRSSAQELRPTGPTFGSSWWTIRQAKTPRSLN